VPVFVEPSLDPDKSLGGAVIAECLCPIDVTLGADFLAEDLTVWDKRLERLVHLYMMMHQETSRSLSK